MLETQGLIVSSLFFLLFGHVEILASYMCVACIRMLIVTLVSMIEKVTIQIPSLERKLRSTSKNCDTQY